MFKKVDSLSDFVDNLVALDALGKLSRHEYLTEKFQMSVRACSELRKRYHKAIELLDAKLEQFYCEAQSLGLLDDTMLVMFDRGLVSYKGVQSLSKQRLMNRINSGRERNILTPEAAEPKSLLTTIGSSVTRANSKDSSQL